MVFIWFSRIVGSQNWVVSTKNTLVLLCSSAFNEESGYVSGWVGAWRHLRYGEPEPPPDCS
jgi:hypothetical protein